MNNKKRDNDTICELVEDNTANTSHAESELVEQLILKAAVYA